MYCRALEASAEENAARMKRKRCEAQSEMCSPADWIRQDDWPVGIRNVGNTCWFSAVIQVGMRRLIGCMKLMRNRERIKLQYSKLGDSIHVFVNQSWLLITITIMRFFILKHYKQQTKTRPFLTIVVQTNTNRRYTTAIMLLLQC